MKRQLVLLMHVSLDGYVAGPTGELDWVKHGDDVWKEVLAPLPTPTAPSLDG